MFKVHRELLTTTSERKSGFNSGEDEFELEDGSNAKALKYSQRINKGKDFRSTDEGSDLENWNSNLLSSNYQNKHSNLLSSSNSSNTNYNNMAQYSATNAQYNANNHLATNINYNNTSTATRQLSGGRKDGACSCCPHGYHVDLDILKSLNADEYENVIKDPKYMLKHHRRLHDMQQRQFQSRNVLSTQSASNLHASLPIPSQHSLQLQHQPRVPSPSQPRFSSSTSNLQRQQQQSYQHQQQQQQQQQTFQQQQQQTFQQQQQQTHHSRQQQRKQQHQSLDNAVMLYGRGASTNTTLNDSRKYSGDFHLSNGHPGNDVNRQETVFVSEDGATTTKVIEEIHKTRTTIIDLDSDTEEAPVKVNQRQKTLEELQRKLKNIQPVDQRGPLKTYVNAADPKPVDEKDEPDAKGPVRKPTFPEEPPAWLSEKEDLLNQIRALQRQKATRETGVGDRRIDEDESKQLVGLTGQPPLPVRTHEKELNTEETTEIKEKELKTIFVGGMDDKFNLGTTNKPVINTVPVTKETRSFGTGDGNVFEYGNKNFEVHEKELRTVYLGGEKPTTRNVGILCKSAMRDVGMVHNSEDEKPMMKNVAVGVGEVGISESDGMEQRIVELNQGAPAGDESFFASSAFMQSSLTSVKGGLNGEKLKAYLDEYLKRTVHSVGTQCQFSTVNKGTDAARIGYELMNVGCGDDSVDVEVIPIREMKSVAIDNRPSLFHSCVGTDIIYKLDVGTNTRTQGLYFNKETNTEPKSVGVSSTNTDAPRLYNQQSGTDIGIFYDLNVLKNSSSMTDDVDMYNKRVNTETQMDHRIGSSSHHATSQEMRREEEQATGYRKYIEETVSPGYLVSYTKTTRNRSKNDRSPSRHSTTTRDVTSRGSSSVQRSSGNRSTSQYSQDNSSDITHQLLGLNRSTDTREFKEADGRTRVVTESKGPGYSETVVKQTFSSRDGDAGLPLGPGVAGFPDQYFSNRSGHSTQSKSMSSTTRQFGSGGHKGGPYYTEKTALVTGGGSQLGEGLASSENYYSTIDDGNQFITQVEYPGVKNSKILVETDKGVIEGGMGGGFEIELSGGGGSGRVVKSSTQKSSYSSSSTSGGVKGSSVVRVGGIDFNEEGFQDAQDYDSLKGGDGKMGVKTVIKESYGPDNIKTIVTEEIEISTGKVLKSTTTQGHYDTLPTFHSSSSSSSSKRGFAKSAFDFAKSGTTTENFIPDAELSSVCQTYYSWLQRNSNVKQKDLDESKAVLHKRWFHTVGSRHASVYMVEGLMNYLHHLSPELLSSVVNFVDANNNTVLHYAVSYGRMDVAACVLSCGYCHVDKQNDVGYTVAMLVCITIATDQNNLPVVKAIFDASNLNIKSSDSSAQTALMFATSHQRDQMVELLLPKCDVNARNSHGSTALMIAAKRGDYEITKMLLAQPDCDLYAIDKDGKTALSIAKECKHQFVVANIEEKIKASSKK